MTTQGIDKIVINAIFVSKGIGSYATVYSAEMARWIMNRVVTGLEAYQAELSKRDGLQAITLDTRVGAPGYPHEQRRHDNADEVRVLMKEFPESQEELEGMLPGGYNGRGLGFVGTTRLRYEGAQETRESVNNELTRKVEELGFRRVY
jgi:hypothetical protein